MMPVIRKWLFRGLLGIALLQCLVSHAIPAILLCAGLTVSVPAWFELFLTNLLALVIVVVLIDVAQSLPGQDRLVRMTLSFTAAATPCLAILLRSSASPYVQVVSALAIVAVFRFSIRRELPLRVYHALSWYGVTWCLGFLGAVYGSGLGSPWSTWLTTAIEVSASLTALAFFVAWCTPLSKVSLNTALIACLAAVDFALLVAIAGHLATGAFLATTGLTLSLPLFVYTLDAFLVVATVLTLMTSNGQSVRGVAVLLLVLSGFSF